MANHGKEGLLESTGMFSLDDLFGYISTCSKGLPSVANVT